MAGSSRAGKLFVAVTRGVCEGPQKHAAAHRIREFSKSRLAQVRKQLVGGWRLRAAESLSKNGHSERMTVPSRRGGPSDIRTWECEPSRHTWKTPKAPASHGGAGNLQPGRTPMRHAAAAAVEAEAEAVAAAKARAAQAARKKIYGWNWAGCGSRLSRSER